MVNGEMVIIIIFAASIRISVRSEEWTDILEEALAFSSFFLKFRQKRRSNQE